MCFFAHETFSHIGNVLYKYGEATILLLLDFDPLDEAAGQ